MDGRTDQLTGRTDPQPQTTFQMFRFKFDSTLIFNWPWCNDDDVRAPFKCNAKNLNSTGVGQLRRGVRGRIALENISLNPVGKTGMHLLFQMFIIAPYKRNIEHHNLMKKGSRTPCTVGGYYRLQHAADTRGCLNFLSFHKMFTLSGIKQNIYHQ